MNISGEGLFEKFFEIGSDLLCIVDQDGNLIMVNRQWEETLGYKKEELLGRCFLDFVCDEYTLKTKEVFAGIKEKGREAESFRNRYFAKNGRKVWLEWKSVRHEGYVFGIARDISAAYRIEKAKMLATEFMKKRFSSFVSMKRDIASHLKEISEAKSVSFEREKNNNLSGLWIKAGFIQDKYWIYLDKKVDTDDGTVLTAAEEYLNIVGKRVERKKASDQLKQNETRFRGLFDNMQEGCVYHRLEYDKKGNPADYIILEANKAFEAITGLKRKNVSGKKATKVYSVPEAPFLSIYSKVAITGIPVTFDVYYEQMEKHFRISVFSPEKDHFATIFFDTTEEKNKTNLISKQKEELRVTLASIGDAVITTDNTGRITSMNPVCEKLTGWDIEDASGLPLMEVFDIYSEETGLKCDDPAGKVLEKGCIIGLANHTALRRRDGSSVSIADSAAPIKNGNETIGVVLVFRDVTEENEKLERIKYMGSHDELTGLYNRAYWNEKVKEIEAAGICPLTVISGDLNGLKIINDIFGHAIGDEALRTVANVLADIFHKPDVTVCRWGGDEFIILMPGYDQTVAEELCARASESIHRQSSIPVGISISFGISVKSALDQSFDIVMKRAEDIMYKHKLLESSSIRGNIINSLKGTLYEKSFETKEHADRLVVNSKAIAAVLGFERSETDELELVAILHDIGKVSVPDTILLKPGKLTEEEFSIMKTHCESGFRIAQTITEISHVAKSILYHHERWDGNGYPDGLAGDAIPLASRIVAITDAYDVMINGRPYKKALAQEEAIRELESNSGTQFDPSLVDVFILYLKNSKQMI